MVKKPVFYTQMSKTEESVSYEDKLPEGITFEQFKADKGVVVWCKYTDCIHNHSFKDTQRTTGTLRKDLNFKPIVESEAVWQGVCTRDEIGISFQSVISPTGGKFKVPSCFVAATNKTGYMDFSRLLQSDGSPYGGSIDSQNPQHAAFHYGTAEYGN